MRRVLLIALLILLITPPVFSQDIEKLPNIFIWSTPLKTQITDGGIDENADAPESDYLTQEEEEKLAEERDAKLLKAQEDSLKQKKKTRKEKKAEEEAEFIKLVQIKDEDTVSATVLKGYAEYKEDSDAVYLKDENNNFVLNIAKPQTITSTKIDLKNSKTFQEHFINTSKYTSDEYRIADKTIEVSSKINNFKIGTVYDSGIFRSQLEQTTSLFATYQKDRFSMKTAFERYSGAMYGGEYYDTYSISPTFKLNENISIKEVLGVDIEHSRKTSELVLQVSPLAHKGNDRINFEVGAKQYFDQSNDMYRTRIRFSTLFKL